MTHAGNPDSTAHDDPITRADRYLSGPAKVPRTLRAVGLALVFVLLTQLIGALGVFALHRIIGFSLGALRAPQTIDFPIIYCLEVSTAVGAMISTWLLSRHSGLSWLDFGLRDRHALRRLVQGAACGLTMMVALMALLALFHGAHFATTHAAPAQLLRNAVLWAGGFALVGVSEEMTFRGFAFLMLARRTHPVFGAVVMSVIFGALHLANGGETWIGALYTILFGLIASLAVWRTGSLWWVFGLHLAVDWSETCLFGVADSGLKASHTLLDTVLSGPTWLTGGSAGVEGSALNMILLAVLAWVIWRVFPARQPDAAAAQYKS